MKVLVLSPYLPVPSQGGGGTTYYYYLKNLSQRHEVHLMCLDRRTPDGASGSLRSFCREVECQSLNRRHSLLTSFAAIFTGGSFRLAYYRSPEFAARVRAKLAREHFDVVIASHERMGQYAVACEGTRRAIDLHDVVSDRHRMLARRVRNPLMRTVHEWEAERLGRYELRCLSEFDSVWVSTPAEGEKLRPHDVNRRVRVTERGIDLQDFSYGLENAGSSDLLFTGHMSYEPNVDAAVYYCREVHAQVRALIPNARVLIVGNYPHKSVQQAAREHADIVVTGRVPSVADYLRRSRVFLAPLRIGTGARIKLLEAMAVGIPIVTTSVGCEGLGVKHEDQILIADQPSEFAQAVRRLFDDPQLYRHLSQSGRRFVEEHYSLDRAAAKVEAILHELVAGARTPGPVKPGA